MKKIIIIILLFVTNLAFSQGEANNWIFGYNAGVNFVDGVSITNSSSPAINLRTEEGCSVFSDSSGKLLFYSDGKTVWAANNVPMPNGKDLLGDSSSTQSAMIIPNPGNVDQYYLFTVGSNYVNSRPGFNYYTIDMTRNGGLGDVIGGPTDLSGGMSWAWTEKVAAVKGSECNTYWVISYDGSNLKSFKVDASGVNTTPVSSSAPAPGLDRRGYLKVSPDGKKIAIAHYLYYGNNRNGEEVPGGDSSVILYDFNDLTGEITNKIRLFDDANNDIHPYGLEFSRRSSKLYISTFDRTNNAVYQYDLESVIIPATQTLINSQIGYRGALQIGPDGKIYATVPVDYWTGTQFLDVINNPDELGLNCGYQTDVINLGSGRATQGLPPFISSIFSPIEITSDDGNGNMAILNGKLLDLCIGENLTINPEVLTGTATYEWSFNNIIISTAQNLVLNSISIADIGDYKLEVLSIDICGRQSFRDGSFSINSVNVPPIAIPTETQLICDENYTGNYTFDLDAQYSSTIMNGQDPTIFEMKYFSSQIDADNNFNQLPNPYITGSTTIYARIHNKNNNDCYQTTSFDLNVFEAAKPLDASSILDLAVCDNISAGTDTDGLVVFDLTERETVILNGQSSTGFTLTYFTDVGYSPTNEILTPSNFTNTSVGGQTIYVRMTNNLESLCFADTSFNIEVFEMPDIQYNMVFKNCDEDGNPDGFTDYNLDEANDYITNGDINLLVSYYTSFANADLGSSPVIASPFNNATASTVYARIETINGCHRVSTIDLRVSTTAFPVGYSQEIQTCDDDESNDGLHLFDLTQASADMIAQFPTGQNLSVHYYRNALDAQLEREEILPQTDYMSETPFSQTIYVRVESDDNGECFGIGPYLTLTVFSRPEFEVNATEIVCLNLPPITLEIFNPSGDYTYIWTDQSNTIISTTSSVDVSTGGEYTVVATATDGTNCESFPQTIMVNESIVANIDSDDVTITDDSDNNTVTINNDNNNLGVGDYEFSLDDEFGPYQDESFFDYVAPGIHTIYVRDKNNCGIETLEISVIGFPKFFTPNNDGQNDTWQVLGIDQDFFPSSLIYIYDRFGKILAKVNPTSNGWSGYYNGEKLPSDDYWFGVTLIDKDGNTRQRKGHFSLIRR